MNRKTTSPSSARFIALSRCCLLLALVGFSSINAQAKVIFDVPPSPSTVTGKPYLQLETGRHTAPIIRIAVDARERYLVTASHDKTARVWELSTGKLLQTLRPPLGDGDEGKLYAVAISPDGAEVAVGGFTGRDGTSDLHIYFFDAASGRLLRQIGQLPNVINHLAYSVDGQYLAAALFGANGIRVYDTAGLQLVGSDPAYGDASFWVEFAPSGRLLSSSLDGFIRLYGQNFKLLKKQAPASGKHPFAARFSPDGDKVALGFEDTTAVEVLAADTLNWLYTADTRAFNNGSLNTVAWSADGQALYAGGRYVDGTGNTLIIKWPQAGRGTATALSAANNTVMDIRSLSRNRLAYGTADPAWGVTDNTGVKRIEITTVLVDHRQSSPDKLRLGADASVVEFVSGGKPKAFSLSDAHYLNASDALLSPAKTSAPGLTITDWVNSTAPKLNGKALSLMDYEISRSLAITADEQHFVLGTGWRLRFFDRLGQQLWEIPTPGAAWAVNISSDQRFAVAAFGDGTIRWYRLTDGKEQLAFFPKNNGEDWVMWTPEGFFNAGGNGKEMIGYALNQGVNKEARFVAASQLYDLFYRPDLIAKRLEQTDQAEAVIQQAVAKIGDVQTVLKAGLPPSLALLSPPQSTQTGSDYTLRFKVTDPGSGVDEFVYKVNGKVYKDRAWPSSTIPGYDPIDRHFSLPPGRNVIEVSAKNPKSLESRTISAVVQVDSPKLPDVNLYVLAIGVSDYRNHALKLNFAANDATALAEELRQRGQGLFKQVFISPPLLNGQATLANIDKAFNELAGKVQPQDVFVLYLAGHGKTVDAHYHFVPWELVYDGKAFPVQQALDQKRLSDLLARIPAQKSLVLLDTCNAGSFTVAANSADQQEKSRGDWSDQTAIDHLMNATGSAVLMASADDKMAFEGYQNHGVFTYALLEGLRKADSNNNRVVEIDELAMYVNNLVPTITKQQWGYEQFPRRDLKGASFPLAGLKP